MLKLEASLPERYALCSIVRLRTRGQWIVRLAIPNARPGMSDPEGEGLGNDLNEAAEKAIDNVEWRLENPNRSPMEYHQSAKTKSSEEFLKELGL